MSFTVAARLCMANLDALSGLCIKACIETSSLTHTSHWAPSSIYLKSCTRFMISTVQLSAQVPIDSFTMVALSTSTRSRVLMLFASRLLPNGSDGSNIVETITTTNQPTSATCPLAIAHTAIVAFGAPSATTAVSTANTPMVMRRTAVPRVFATASMIPSFKDSFGHDPLLNPSGRETQWFMLSLTLSTVPATPRSAIAAAAR